MLQHDGMLCQRTLFIWALSRPSDVPSSSTRDYVGILPAHFVCRQQQLLTCITCLFACTAIVISTLLQLRSGFSALRMCTTSQADALFASVG